MSDILLVHEDSLILYGKGRMASFMERVKKLQDQSIGEGTLKEIKKDFAEVLYYGSLNPTMADAGFKMLVILVMEAELMDKR